jgi:hypothetical protein
MFTVQHCCNFYAASGDASDWMAGGPVDANGNSGSGKMF